jgi:hypothetical protein
MKAAEVGISPLYRFSSLEKPVHIATSSFVKFFVIGLAAFKIQKTNSN